jgi:type VI secretion system protein ImpG
MTTLRYYQEEMRYLHEAGKEFAESHPEEAKLLNAGSVTDRDPYVERLFEGFAFLTARIRERLDDELPEYTHGLLNLLWPHLLRPIPALSIVEFKPIAGLVQQTTAISRGSEVCSAPVGEEQTVCRFTTTQAVQLQPFRLSDASLAWPSEGASTVTLRFNLDRGAVFSRLTPSPLRLYLHADPSVASLMHLFFTRHVSCVTLRAVDTGATHSLYGQQWISPGGLSEDDALLPYSPNAFRGFRLLQEYLAFRQKFWFVDLLGLEHLPATEKTTEFEVEVAFDRAYPENRRFNAANLRLFCAPIVNLFSHDAEPMRVDHRASEYEVVPDVHRPRTVETYDVERVSGIDDHGGKRHEYQPYFAFERGPSQPRWFTATQRYGAHGRSRAHLTFGGADVSSLHPETVSLALRCTNGTLPRELLHEKMINQPSPGFPRIATFENLTQPTTQLQPPAARHDELYWRLLTQLSLSNRTLATREGLADLLSLHDWTDGEANARRIAGIRRVTWTPKDIVKRRAPVRGGEVIVEVRDDHFSEEGDLALFGTVLSRVLAMYATLNSFVHLTFVAVPSGRRQTWTPESGEGRLL